MISDRLRSLLIKYEGRRNDVYRDPIGIPTVGIGHVVRKEEGLYVGNSIGDDEIDALFLIDVRAKQRGVYRLVTTPATTQDYQIDALISFAFNLGLGNLKNSTLLKYVNNGEYDRAAPEFEKWVNAGQPPRPLPGLIRRRKSERLIFEGKDDDI